MSASTGRRSDRPRAARLSPADLLRLGGYGLRSRPFRAVLAAAGIALGIATILAVVGISASGRAEVDQRLERLGTNLLTLAPGETVSGEPARLPPRAAAMVDRIGPVTHAAATGEVDADVYRTDRIPAGNTNGIAVFASSSALPETVGATPRTGRWLNQATASYPGVVLGHTAAEQLGVRHPGVRVWLGGTWFGVVGVLEPVGLADELDNAALVGRPAAQKYLGFDGHPTTVYSRSVESQVEAVRTVLAPTVVPDAPETVQISRPSDALQAKRATNRAMDRLLLGLGGVGLLIGGVGVANTMVISVLERRSEIALRRALGATRGQIRGQFATESVLLSVLGGGTGIVLGVVATGVYASFQGWPTVVPVWVTAGGFGATLLIGALAGLYPAIRAARLAPAEVLGAA